MASRGGKKPKKRVPVLIGLPGNGFCSNPVLPEPETYPVPGKITLALENAGEVDIEPDDMRSVETLGRGVHGQVEKMIHLPSAHTMAVKTIPWKLNSGDESKLLKRELDVSMLASSCTHVVRCYGAMYKEGYVWICMEVMDASLERFYEAVFAPPTQCTIMPEPLLARVAFCVMSALQYLKTELNVIHRDIKPSNILINRSGVVKICDFGISGKLVNSLARSHVGTRNYMAPERVHSEDQAGYNITSDVWSLGISMIEIATGQYPYKQWKTPFDQLEQVVKGDPPRLPHNQFSQDFEDFIHRCLKKDPTIRSRYEELLHHSFITRYQDTDVSTFVSEVLDKLLVLNKTTTATSS